MLTIHSLSREQIHITEYMVYCGPRISLAWSRPIKVSLVFGPNPHQHLKYTVYLLCSDTYTKSSTYVILFSPHIEIYNIGSIITSILYIKKQTLKKVE